MSQRILVPFDEPGQLRSTLAHVLPVAEQLSAEVVLLRVNLPPCPSTRCVDWGQLFSELKALQAQLPVSTVRITLETNPGPAEQAIYHYAEQHRVDLIFAPDLTPNFVLYPGADPAPLGPQAREQAGPAAEFSATSF